MNEVTAQNRVELKQKIFWFLIRLKLEGEEKAFKFDGVNLLLMGTTLIYKNIDFTL